MKRQLGKAQRKKKITASTTETARARRGRRFLRRNFLALLSLVLTILIPFIIYYLAYSGPDLRQVPQEMFQLKVSPPIKNRNGDCFYYATARPRFKNLSFNSGYVDKVIFVPMTEDVIADIQLIEVDKALIGWREEKTVDIRFSYALPPAICSKKADLKENIVLDLKYYDNTGKLINKEVSGDRYQGSVTLVFNEPSR